MDECVLKIESVVKVFPGVTALKDAHLEIKKGEVHAICGENGAGKSTLMKIVAGAQPYTSGHMYVDGSEVVFHSTRDAEKQGIAMIYQEFNMVPELTVAENMYLGRLPQKAGGAVDWAKLYRDADAVLGRLKLNIGSRTRVKHLSVAESQMTEIAKCLTIGARIIIMDEPTAALTEEEIKILFDTIQDLKQRGISIIYISHRMDEIFQIADRLTVFRDGRYIATKNIRETNYGEVVSMMVGRSVDTLYPRREYRRGELVFEARNICGKGVYDVSIDLHRGEILGISGLMGSGAIELSKMIYGALLMDSGAIFVNGKKIDCSDPNRAIAGGIGFVSDDRKKEGLVLGRSIRENVTLSSLKKFTRGIRLDQEKELKHVREKIDRLRIKVSGPFQLAGKLSGGNQQKVVFAKVLETDTPVLILDEPTRGVDVGAKAEIYRIMDQMTRQGKSIILISTDLPEMIGMSDRVIVMREGRRILELSKEELSQEKLLAYESGGIEE